MKKLAIIAAFLMVPMFASAQGVFDSYENETEVTTVVITKNMFKILGQVEMDQGDPEVKDYLEMIDGLDNIKIFITENPNIGVRMKADVKRYVAASNGLDELMRIKKDDANVKLYSKQGIDESHISELLVFVHGEMDGKQGTVVATVSGDIDLKHLSTLTKSMDLPATDFVVSPNPATDQITINSKGKAISSVVIFDSSGREVYSEDNLSATSKQISIATFAKGLYLVSVNDQMTQKVLKK